MQRDINNLRDFETGDGLQISQDIVRKKNKLKEIFESDPDLKEILNAKSPLPMNKFQDETNPTEAEKLKREEIIHYNENIKHEQIIPWIKLNGIQTEVLNFLMFDIEDENVVTYNDSIKYQNLIVQCLVHESDMMTEYEIPRTDLLDAVVKDLLLGSNVLTNRIQLIQDEYRIVDNDYYARVMTFRMKSGNGYGQAANKYDRLKV